MCVYSIITCPNTDVGYAIKWRGQFWIYEIWSSLGISPQNHPFRCQNLGDTVFDSLDVKLSLKNVHLQVSNTTSCGRISWIFSWELLQYPKCFSFCPKLHRLLNIYETLKNGVEIELEKYWFDLASVWLKYSEFKAVFKFVFKHLKQHNELKLLRGFNAWSCDNIIQESFFL